MDDFHFIIIYFLSLTVFSCISIWCRLYKSSSYPFTKPLPILIIAFFFIIHFFNIYAHSSFEKMPQLLFWLFPGLILSLIGDILLLKDSRFIRALFSFLIAQFFYIKAFFNARWEIPLWLLSILIIAFLVYGSLLGRSLYLKNKRKFILPIMFYNAVILSMLGYAINRHILDESGLFPYFALGAFFFCISDGIIGWNRFARPFNFAPALILIFYYSAQAFIILGAIMMMRSM